jgi:hypothetical protein
MGKITYIRGTSYSLTHNYTAPNYPGTKLIFGVKSVPNDTDPTDATNAIIAPKSIAMTGSTFPQSTVITINPTDVALTVAPGNYFYAIKIFDSNKGEYVVDSGSFVLTASSLNETVA